MGSSHFQRATVYILGVMRTKRKKEKLCYKNLINILDLSIIFAFVQNLEETELMRPIFFFFLQNQTDIFSSKTTVNITFEKLETNDSFLINDKNRFKIHFVRKVYFCVSEIYFSYKVKSQWLIDQKQSNLDLIKDFE